MKHILFTLALLVSAPNFAQEPPFQESIDVHTVLVDAIVTDKRGNQILGLDKQDFVVKENGVEQQIDSLDYFTNRRLLTSPESKAAFKVERVREERYFILFFHELLDAGVPVLGAQLRRAEREAERFVDERMLPTDRVAVAGFDARLKIYSDFTSDKRQLRHALRQVIPFSAGLRQKPSNPAPDSILDQIDLQKMINRTGTVYDALEMLANSLDSIRARKTLIFFSPGVGEPSRTMPEILENEEHDYRPMINSFHRANLTVHSINLLPEASSFPTQQTLSRMAADTGGEYSAHAVSFRGPLANAEKTNSGYYLLSYRTRKSKSAAGFQKLEVSLRNPEFTVKARKGYAF